MKRLLGITALILFTGLAFGQTTLTTQVDFETEKAALNDLLDKIDAAILASDISTMASYLSEDFLMCGTDPSEFWNKQYFVDLSKQDSNDPTPEFKYIDDRKIKVAPDGNSAIVVTQFILGWSPKIPLRMAYHFVKTNDNWMILFCNIAFIPKNEEIETINGAID